MFVLIGYPSQIYQQIWHCLDVVITLYYKMQVISISILFVFLLNIASASPTKTKYIEGTGCTFVYLANSSSFSIQKCINNNNQQYNTWGECLQLCCQDMSAKDYLIPSEQSLQDCEVENEENSPSTIVVVILVVLLVFLIIVLLACIFILFWKMWIRYNQSRVINQIQSITLVEWKDQKQLCHNKENIVWSGRAQINHRLQSTDKSCSICLDDHPTAQLFCRHQYHPHCIALWLNKSTCCPFCRREDIRGIKVYCAVCRWRYMMCTRTFLSLEAEELPKNCRSCAEEINTRNSLQQLIPNTTDFVFDFQQYEANIHSQMMIAEDVNQE